MRNKNIPSHLRNKILDYHWIYEFLHSNHPKYGWSPTREFEFVIMTMNIRPSSILDVGCGNGQLLKFLHKRTPNIKLHGCDISQSALDKIDLDDATLEVATAQNLQYLDTEFDLVICMDVLEHLAPDNIPKALQELKRVSKAHVLIQTDTAECLEDKYLEDTKYKGLKLHTQWELDVWRHHIRKSGLTKCIPLSHFL